MKQENPEIDIDNVITAIESGECDSDMVRVEDAIRRRRKTLFDQPSKAVYLPPQP